MVASIVSRRLEALSRKPMGTSLGSGSPWGILLPLAIAAVLSVDSGEPTF